MKLVVKTSCIEICAELRRHGFGGDGITTTIPEEAITAAIKKQKWSPTTRARYRGAGGFLVEFEFLKIVPGGYALTGEDLNE